MDLATWRYLRPIYEAVPRDPAGFELVIQKSAQGGASILSLLFVLWLALRGRYQIAYFLPTQAHALAFSTNRFIRLARENKAIHRLMGDPETPHARRVVDEGSASVRRLLSSIIYFTFMGGKITTEALPLDSLVLDEVQEMGLAEIQKAEERISASPLRTILRVSTPNWEQSDINFFFQQSDQRWFHTRCNCPDGIVLAEAWDPKLGPLCIGKGNGTTPGIPVEPFYRCPRCDTIIEDPQEGEYIARNPGAKAVGFHFPQMLSPRQTAGDILEKWERRVDTATFYRRVLGRPYTDPDTQPVTEAHLSNAQNPDLRWGPPKRDQHDGVFMGVDQMGGDNRAVLVGRQYGSSRMRLLHLEAMPVT
ncbi:MAG: phage terminase large subunit family protein [bacterium]